MGIPFGQLKRVFCEARKLLQVDLMCRQSALNPWNYGMINFAKGKELNRPHAIYCGSVNPSPVLPPLYWSV